MQNNFLNLKPGDHVKVTGVDQGDSNLPQQAVIYGIDTRSFFRIIRTAPMVDPLEILVNGFHLSLRRKEADILNIEMLKQ